MSNRQPGELAQFLLDGAEYLSKPNQWCRNRDHKKTGYLWWRKDAYCAIGYIWTKTPTWSHVRLEHLLYDAAQELHGTGMSPMTYNDQYGQMETVKMFNKAARIAMARGL